MTNQTLLRNRTAARVITVGAGAAGCLLLWAVNGRDITVVQNGIDQQVGPVAVVVTALIAGLAAWGLLAVLERKVRRPARVFRIVASIVLLISLAGPLGSGADTVSVLALAGMHLTVGLAAIIGLPGRRFC
ncbi:hypothetical protein FB565_007471 [Actinoplanes lutulentus]|nr:DUF6069 family protein [Actinoplanes lutulentus]MBB2947700.1 hypothetical protein [Actinoplanes lutulentus]